MRRCCSFSGFVSQNFNYSLFVCCFLLKEDPSRRRSALHHIRTLRMWFKVLSYGGTGLQLLPWVTWELGWRAVDKFTISRAGGICTPSVCSLLLSFNSVCYLFEWFKVAIVVVSFFDKELAEIHDVLLNAILDKAYLLLIWDGEGASLSQLRHEPISWIHSCIIGKLIGLLDQDVFQNLLPKLVVLLATWVDRRRKNSSCLALAALELGSLPLHLVRI